MVNQSRIRELLLLAGVALSVALAHRSAADAAPPASMPDDARYVCPMETHPDEEDPARQGAYFASEAGDCPWCGMKLKPVEELSWARTRLAAQGGDVAYTCPRHQHVFSTTEGQCPRCGDRLEPFKVMYTCPDPRHAPVIRAAKERCTACGRRLAPFRSVWLNSDMAAANMPATTQPAVAAAYRCALHPLVHSSSPGRCTICAADLQFVSAHAATRPEEHDHVAEAVASPGIPAGARYTCPMQECEVFSSGPADCPKCGMKLKPIEEIEWARSLAEASPATTPAAAGWLCPMHPQKARSDRPGTCPICAMQLVSAGQFEHPTTAPARVQRELDHITEHYLTIQQLLASDSMKDIARHALGIVSASEELLKHVPELEDADREGIKAAAGTMHDAALKITGQRIADDRVHLVALSEGMTALLERLRPDKQRWPKLFIFHCPMSKGDWMQAVPDKANPYYGFSMLKCGELKDTK